MKSLIAHLFGDYVVQSDWMAKTKTTEHGPALAHAASYAACFLPQTRSLRALVVIGGTHYAIDHWRLAKHVVWAKNQIAPSGYRYPYAESGPFGYHRDQPDWLAGWLLFIADNAIHLAINEWALERWSDGGRPDGVLPVRGHRPRRAGTGTDSGQRLRGVRRALLGASGADLDRHAGRR